MLTATKAKTKAKATRKKVQKKPDRAPRVFRFPGIVADARELGVNRVTLYRVLTGEFTHLPGLRRRYDALKSTQPKSTQPKSTQPK